MWDSVSCKAWLLGHPYLLTVALLVAFAIDGRYQAAWLALAVLAVLVVVWVFAALNPRAASPDTYSLPMRRLVGFLATGLDRLADSGDGLPHRAVQPRSRQVMNR